MPSPPPNTRLRGADLLVQALRAARVRRVFTLSGNHIMAVFDALLGSGIGLVHVRHEAAAVHMADAWARLTGEVGVALVTGGPGHANALGALYTAAMAESPVLLLSGHAPLSQLGRGAFQEMRQADAAAPLCKAGGAWTCGGASHLTADVARALRLAASGRPGPVHLSLPSDVLEAPIDEAATPNRETNTTGFAAEPLPLPALEAERLLAWLGEAERPLILAGPVALTPAGRPLAAALQAATGVPVIGMESPRGIADPSLGAFAEVLAHADAVLLLAKRLDFTLRFGETAALDAAARFAQIDPEAAEFERSRRAVGARLQLTAVADAASAMGGLLDAASAATPAPAPTRGSATATATATAWPKPKHADWLTEVQEAVAWRPASWSSAASSQPECLHPVQALSPLQALLNSHPRSVLISDGGEFGQWAQAVLHAPCRLINGVAGAIGAALPFAVAARLAEPEAPVVTVMGDGTFGFHLSEIDTAVRSTAPFIALVGNDARWNAEHQIQLREFGAARHIGCELLPARYDLATVGLGGHGEWVTAAAHLPAALARAQASGLPACVNVMIEGLPAPNLRRAATTP